MEGAMRSADMALTQLSENIAILALEWLKYWLQDGKDNCNVSMCIRIWTFVCIYWAAMMVMYILSCTVSVGNKSQYLCILVFCFYFMIPVLISQLLFITTFVLTSQHLFQLHNICSDVTTSVSTSQLLFWLKNCVLGFLFCMMFGPMKLYLYVENLIKSIWNLTSGIYAQTPNA